TEKFSINLLGNISLNHFNFKPTDRETSFGTLEDVKHFKVYFDGEERDKFETYFGVLSFNYKKNRSTSFSASVGAFMTNEFVSYDISGEYWIDQA
ncbi:MAG: TonB-dependent receptor, partial [Muribaculaceae bacterium]|nr:TonB-dependent receptor [Muribaculaceae bacterium]